MVEELESLVDGDPFKRPEQCCQRGRPTRFRKTCQGGRSHFAGRACETLDHRVGRARWREVQRADRINPLQMRHEFAGSEASRRTEQLLDQRRAVSALEEACDIRRLLRVKRARHVVPALLLNPCPDPGAEPFQGAHTGQQHLLGEKPGNRMLHQQPRLVVARPAQRIEPAHQAEAVKRCVGEVPETVSLLDQSDMASGA